MSNRFCGSEEQRFRIAAQREKEKARSKRKKEEARKSKQTKAAMQEDEVCKDDIAQGDASEHSELQPSPLPAALDMRIEKSTRSAREPVLLLPDRLPAQEMVAQELHRHTKVEALMQWSSADVLLGTRQVDLFSPTQQGPTHQVASERAMDCPIEVMEPGMHMHEQRPQHRVQLPVLRTERVGRDTERRRVGTAIVVMEPKTHMQEQRPQHRVPPLQLPVSRSKARREGGDSVDQTEENLAV